MISVRDNVAVCALYSAFLITSFIFLVLTIECVLFALYGQIHSSVIIFSFLATILVPCFFYIRKQLNLVTLLISCSVYLITLLVSFFVAGSFYDISYDGQTYHQEAIIKLAEGWNPFYNHSPPTDHHRGMLTYYSKGPWIIEAAIFKLTHGIEYGKALNFLMIFDSLFVSLSFLMRIKSLSWYSALLGSILAALNPVSIYQYLTFYVDTQLVSAFTAIMMMSLSLLLNPAGLETCILFMLLVIGLNIKMTMVAYLLILNLVIIIVIYIYRGQFLPKIIKTYVKALFLGLLFVGFNPYVTNTIDKGYPFYPIGVEDVLYGQRPKNFIELNRLEKIWLSIFGKPEIRVAPSQPAIPFWTTIDDVKIFRGADVRVAGWGPLFSGAIILAGIGLFLIILRFNRNRHVVLLSLATIIAVLLTILVNSESWWARLAPQVYLIPLIISITLLFFADRISRIFGFLIITILIINSSLIAYVNFQHNYQISAILRNQLQKLASFNGKIDVYFNTFWSNRNRFDKSGIPYTEVSSLQELPCQSKFGFAGSIIVFCLPDTSRFSDIFNHYE